jgi:hypothetical protein
MLSTSLDYLVVKLVAPQAFRNSPIPLLDPAWLYYFAMKYAEREIVADPNDPGSGQNCNDGQVGLQTLFYLYEKQIAPVIKNSNYSGYDLFETTRDQAAQALSDLEKKGGCQGIAPSPTPTPPPSPSAAPVPSGTYNFTSIPYSSVPIEPIKGFNSTGSDSWVSFYVTLPPTTSPINATIRMTVKPILGSLSNDHDILACTANTDPLYVSFAGLSTEHYTTVDVPIHDPATLQRIQSGSLECYIGIEEAVQSVQLIVTPASGAPAAAPSAAPVAPPSAGPSPAPGAPTSGNARSYNPSGTWKVSVAPTDVNGKASVNFGPNTPATTGDNFDPTPGMNGFRTDIKDLHLTYQPNASPPSATVTGGATDSQRVYHFNSTGLPLQSDSVRISTDPGLVRLSSGCDLIVEVYDSIKIVAPDSMDYSLIISGIFRTAPDEGLQGCSEFLAESARTRPPPPLLNLLFATHTANADNIQNVTNFAIIYDYPAVKAGS